MKCSEKLDFQIDLELQRKKLYTRINPILLSYDKDEISRKEFLDKIMEAFYLLGKNIEER